MSHFSAVCERMRSGGFLKPTPRNKREGRVFRTKRVGTRGRAWEWKVLEPVTPRRRDPPTPQVIVFILFWLLLGISSLKKDTKLLNTEDLCVCLQGSEEMGGPDPGESLA